MYHKQHTENLKEDYSGYEEVENMLINQEFINHLTPVEISFIRIGIDKLFKEKVTSETTNYENVSAHVTCCPHCGSERFVKNGFNPHHRQKYRCKDCKSVFMATTGTMFTHSKTSFDKWSTFIAGELNCLTLEQQSVATGLSKTTCFNMRHKLYKAASKIQNEVVLSGDIELDPTYTSINLKGTKPKNMPRYSKHRGKSRKSTSSSKLRGINHHKVCIVTAIDENDNILYKVGGLGRESADILNRFRDHFSPISTIISDDSHSIQTFVSDNKLKSEIIPSNGTAAPSGKTVSSTDELHTELKSLIRWKRGISTRHLQGYLDWLVLRKKLKYTLDMRKWKSEAYMTTMMEQIPFRCNEITRIPLPINLFTAYGEYHYGIFSFIN